MATNYKPIDGKVGISSPGAVPPTAKNWLPSTAYDVPGNLTGKPSFVVNGAFAFQCSVAGTSAAGAQGPTPTLLTDNTVTWVLVGAISPMYAQDAAPAVELGYIAVAVDPTYGEGEFLYTKFTGTVHAGDFVVVDRQGLTCVALPTVAPGASKLSIVGISMGEQLANTYGWVMIRGVHDQANVTAALTVGSMFTGGGASAGRVAQATANYLIESAVLRAAGVAGCGTVELYWPVSAGR
jgi:hypothetical protein